MDVKLARRAEATADDTVGSRVPALTALRAFVSAAEHLSFTRAAEALGVTHGAVIHHVNALERRLDRRLVERGPRSIRLTPEGIELYQRMVHPLRQLEGVFETVGVRRMQVVVTTVPSFATGWLMPRMSTLLAAIPGISLVVKPENAIVDLANADADLAIRLGEGNWPGLTTALLARDEVFPVASASYPLLRQLRSPQDLQHVTMIENPLLPWSRWFEIAGCTRMDVRNRVVVADSLAAQMAAEGGAGVALARRLLARQSLQNGRLVRLFEPALIPAQSWWAAWRPSNPKYEVLAILVAAITLLLRREAA